MQKQRILIAFENTSQTIPSTQQAFHLRRFGKTFFLMTWELDHLNHQNLIYINLLGGVINWRKMLDEIWEGGGGC